MLKAEVFVVTPALGYTVRFAAKAGRGYTVEFKDGLADPAWQTLKTFPAPASDTVLENADPTAQPQRFYRVRVSSP